MLELVGCRPTEPKLYVLKVLLELGKGSKKNYFFSSLLLPRERGRVGGGVKELLGFFIN